MALLLNGNAVGSITHHRSIDDANDANFAAISSGVDCSGFRYAQVDVVLDGTTPSYDVTPGFYNDTVGDYVPGVKRTVSGTDNLSFIIQVNGNSSVKFLCDGKSGTNPDIDIYVTPFN
jgi:hypothetical protein